MSFLSVIQDVCGRQGLVKPTAVAGNADRQITQLAALANQAGRELARDYAWQALTEETSFVTQAQPVQAAALPSDFDRFIPDSAFNRSTMRPVGGPLTPQQWQALKAFPVLSTYYLLFRERQGQFLLEPSPPAGQSIFYEYVSLNWVKSSAVGPSNLPAYVNDADSAFLDETLIADSVEWRFLAKKGLSYSEEMATFERNKEKAMARDGGSSALSMSAPRFNLDRVNIPDGNFPGP